MLGWGGDQRLDPTAPDYWERAVYAVRYAYEHGIRTEFTVYADLFAFPSLQTQRGREAHADRFISEFRDMAHMFQLIEGCNEPGNPDLWSHYGTPQELVDITRRIGDGLGVPWAPGALYGGRDASTAWWLPDGSIAPEAKTLIAGGQSVSMHFDRGVGAEGLWRPVRQPWEGKNTAENKPFLDNEPVGFQSSVTSYDDDNSHTAMRPDTRQLHRIAAAASWMAGAAFYCWHTEGGTGYSSERPIRNEPGLAEVCAARAALPADLPNFDKHNWHWASNPIETVAENGGTGCIYDRDMKGRGTLRTIGATNGGRVVEHAFCSPEGATFRARTGLDLSKLMYQDGAYREVDRISVSYGQTWQQEPMLDVLYVGRFK
jgi:hypothetical protein